MILDGTILTDNNRNIKIINSICVKKGELQPNNKIAKSQNWWYEVECLNCGYKYFVHRGKLISRKDGCPACSGRKTVIGINDLNTVRPDLIKYLKNKSDGMLYTQHSKSEILCKCPNCGAEKYMSIGNLSNNGFYCSVCSDGISYPNKFMVNILKQLNVDFISEYSPSWIGRKRYDFYIPSLFIIIEMDGMQHKKESGFMNDLDYIKRNDYYKEFMAKKNGIKVIRIDCSKSNMKFIKNNILNSEINNLLDLNKIDWEEVEIHSHDNLMLKACELKSNNDLYTTYEIGNILSVSQATITEWLKIGNKIGLCNYDPKKEMSRNGKRGHEIFNKSIDVYDLDDNFIFNADSIKDTIILLKDKFNVSISRTSISHCCTGKIKSCKGYKFKYCK